MNEHWYYLHKNGSLIHKSTWPGEDNSDLVLHIWPCDPSARETAWRIVVEGAAYGASLDDLRRLIEKWQCTPQDLVHYLAIPNEPNPERLAGLDRLFTEIWLIDREEYFNWLSATQTQYDMWQHSDKTLSERLRIGQVNNTHTRGQILAALEEGK